MAEGTYEYECMRAELLGIDKPNEEVFEKAKAERLEKEKAEQEAAESAMLENQEESLQSLGGKFEELNSILSSTQQKLNRFKQTACGSFSNMFGRGSVDLTADGPSTSSSATSSRRNTTAIGGGSNSSGNETTQHHNDGDLNTALENLDEMQEEQKQSQFPSVGIQPMIPTEKIRAAKLDIQKKMTSHLDKLDSLINKAENAEISMSEQTKQMRKIAD